MIELLWCLACLLVLGSDKPSSFRLELYERGTAIQRGLPRLVDYTHAGAANFAQKLEVPQSLLRIRNPRG